MVTRRKDIDIGALAAYAERTKAEGDPSGFISGSAVVSEFAIILGGCLEFDSEVPESEARRILSRVALSAAQKRPITADCIIRECSKHEREYLEQPKVSFRLLTEMSIWWTIDIPPIRLGSTHLTFKPKLASGFDKRGKLFADSRHTLGFDLPQHYMHVSARVKARSVHDAAATALNDLDLVRASWNLALNRGKSWRYTSGRPTPVNDIRLSPFHTLHKLNGELATETYWYDPGYNKPAQVFSDKRRFANLLTFSKNLRARLSKLDYRIEIEDALTRYVRALDSADLNDAFLRLWSLLEYLTDTGQDPYKVTIRRAALLFEDRAHSLLVLSHLANHRNRFVHSGSDSNDIESLVFLLKRYVDSLLFFHLGNRFKFESRSDAARFLELPPTKAEIDQRILRLRQARRFVNGAGAA